MLPVARRLFFRRRLRRLQQREHVLGDGLAGDRAVVAAPLLDDHHLVAGGGAPFALDRSGITVTVLGDGRAIEIAGCPAP